MNDLLLTQVNAALAVVDFLLAMALVYFLRFRLHSEERGKTTGRVHARVGVVLIIFFALLGMTTGVGTLLQDDVPLFVVRLVAMMLRVGILVLLGSWVLFTIEPWLRHRFPRLSKPLDRVLYAGLL